MAKCKGDEIHVQHEDEDYSDDNVDSDIEFDDDNSFNVPESTVDEMMEEYNQEKALKKALGERTPEATSIIERQFDEIEKRFTGQSSNQMATTRIMKDRREMAKNGNYDLFEIDFVNDNIYVWSLLMRFPETEDIQKNLNDYEIESKGNHPNAIKMEITFPQDFPMSPPFMRVISPRFKYKTGRVTIGGSICTELLTSAGWVPTYSVGQALIQVQSEIMDGKAAFEPYGTSKEYSDTEAKEAFARIAREKGWSK
uniref:UBC core domain-containing protein n=1 Tax=viral metagenome TaxID=1070528 RepID=A0A6C0E944_9ZZZZ